MRRWASSIHELAAQHVRVPNGFALTVHAYYDALESAGAWQNLHALLDDLDVTDVALLSERAAEARKSSMWQPATTH